MSVRNTLNFLYEKARLCESSTLPRTLKDSQGQDVQASGSWAPSMRSYSGHWPFRQGSEGWDKFTCHLGPRNAVATGVWEMTGLGA